MKNDDIEFLPEMLEGETAKAYKAMVDYLRMGPSRSISKLRYPTELLFYRVSDENTGFSDKKAAK